MIVSTRSLLFSSAVVLALAACKKEAPQAPPPPEVSVLAVQPLTLPLQRDLVGRLSAYRTADVRARVAGVLQKRLYTEGTDVKEGQVLFQIDPAPLQAALSSAQGQLASAQATYANAKVNADRARSLAPQQFVSRSDLDTAQATERTAAASVQEAQAAVQTARINLGYSRVVAPISGRAGQQQVTEGALVGSSDVTLLTTVDQIDPLYVNFSISSAELQQLRDAQKQGSINLNNEGKTTIDLALSDGRKYEHQGTLDFSAVTVDTSTNAVSLRAILPNPEHSLLPGAFVSFQATLGQRSNVFLVPQAAIQRDSNGAFALVVGGDGKVVRKNIETDGQQQSQWVVTNGLSAGDQVIVDGLQKAKENQPAKPTPWQPAKASATAAAPTAQK